MPLYDKPVRLLMRDMADSLLTQPGQTVTRQQAIDWFSSNYPKIKPGTVTIHLTRLSINAASRIHYSPRPMDDDLFFQIDSGHFRRYDPSHDPAPIHGSNRPDVAGVVVAEEDEFGVSQTAEFAYEKDLRNYLAKNLSVLEPILKLYEDEDIKGIEFSVGGRFIDILAVDSQNDFVVIELKVSRGYDRVVGQLMRYMAWIQKNLAEPGQRVRGVIVAREISEDLLLACSLLPNVQLFEYEMSLALNRVDTSRSS